jgi:hypothetical protein
MKPTLLSHLFAYMFVKFIPRNFETMSCRTSLSSSRSDINLSASVRFCSASMATFNCSGNPHFEQKPDSATFDWLHRGHFIG